MMTQSKPKNFDVTMVPLLEGMQRIEWQNGKCLY